MRELPVMIATVSIATLTTRLPAGELAGQLRMQKLYEREEDLRAHGRHGYLLRSSVVVPAGDDVLLVDTLSREEQS
jgi:hypothetical protein